MLEFNISFHFYADDTQLYFSLKPTDKKSIDNLLSCLDKIKAWMALSFLQLNQNKCEIVVFGPPDSVRSITDMLGPLSNLVSPFARNLGVIFDSDLSFDRQINAVVKNSFFQLRRISKIKPVLSPQDLEKVIHALVASRLDYCNSLYLGITDKSLNRLQLVLNASARLLTGTKKYESIRPKLATLHWLPLRQRIDFKVLLLVYKAQNGMAPGYISDLIPPLARARSGLRSEKQKLLADKPGKFKKRSGDRAFAVAAPKLWSKLPLTIRLAPSIGIFKSELKTHLYKKAFPNQPSPRNRSLSLP